MSEQTKSPNKHAKALSSLGAQKGGKARTAALTPDQRAELARKASLARWSKQQVTIKQAREAEAALVKGEPTRLPIAKYRGILTIMDAEVPCYVLENGDRVIGRTSATELLSGTKGGGALERYLEASALRPFIDLHQITSSMIPFELPEIAGLERQAKGLPASVFIDICKGLVSALEASRRPESTVKLTDRQKDIAINAGMFLAACAKVGIDALIDEATGYQYDRPEDALQVKLRAYLEAEMRKWEKTFPDDLWLEFARITKWSGSVTRRPKYWGKLVMEFIYEYLDPDVAQWLKENAPAPRHGRNYHQWLSSQYGLKKLVEHIWRFMGISSTCRDVTEVRQRMKEIMGRGPLQMVLKMSNPGS